MSKKKRGVIVLVLFLLCSVSVVALYEDDNFAVDYISYLDNVSEKHDNLSIAKNEKRIFQFALKSNSSRTVNASVKSDLNVTLYSLEKVNLTIGNNTLEVYDKLVLENKTKLSNEKKVILLEVETQNTTKYGIHDVELRLGEESIIIKIYVYDFVVSKVLNVRFNVSINYSKYKIVNMTLLEYNNSIFWYYNESFNTSNKDIVLIGWNAWKNNVSGILFESVYYPSLRFKVLEEGFADYEYFNLIDFEINDTINSSLINNIREQVGKKIEESELIKKCGDNICDDRETSENCPEDCIRCVDSDFGPHYKEYGKCRESDGEVYADECDRFAGLFKTNTLIEYYCSKRGYCYSVDVDCNELGEGYVCKKGACVAKQKKERVKCIFKGSTTSQKCYSDRGSCSGVKSCIVDVTGRKNEELIWKSSCGGNFNTRIDGVNEDLKFLCDIDCVDSDLNDDYPKGKNIYTKGNVRYSDGSLKTDYCLEADETGMRSVVEYSCPYSIPDIFYCLYDCKDGACVYVNHSMSVVASNYKYVKGENDYFIFYLENNGTTVIDLSKTYVIIEGNIKRRDPIISLKENNLIYLKPGEIITVVIKNNDTRSLFSDEYCNNEAEAKIGIFPEQRGQYYFYDESNIECYENKGCIETDSGNDINVKGNVSFGDSNEDSCDGRLLIEYICSVDEIEKNYFLCQYGCEDGECEQCYEGCKGNAETCVTFKNSSCKYQDGCYWRLISSDCFGTCRNCSSYNDKKECKKQRGCYWSKAMCAGEPIPCNSYNNTDECEEHGCDWLNWECTSKLECDEYVSRDKCLNVGCEWVEDKCVGIPWFCSYYKDEKNCVKYDCSWQRTIKCSGEPMECSEYDEEDCSYGCVWKQDTCEGLCEQCYSLNKRKCDKQDGCNWEEKRNCVGIATNCGFYSTDLSCNSQSGCYWKYC